MTIVRRRRGWRALAASGASLLAFTHLDAGLAESRVVTDETVTTSPLWNSGASPMWCGSPPDHRLDLLGAETKGDQITLRYLHVHIP